MNEFSASQQTFTCSQSTVELLEKGVKYVYIRQSFKKIVLNKHVFTTVIEKCPKHVLGDKYHTNIQKKILILTL